ncbi:MAG: hypothetical protein U5Q16_05415 [Gammaproteobacteria bacterium]|nr:hypothetical protein [Gammaproteobacteria bacterium]
MLTGEALDLFLEVQQNNFNLMFGTGIDWVGNENLQFVGDFVENLSAEQIAQLSDQISRYVTRRIEQNAALGEQGELNMLEDVGYIVGTIAGAEEAAVRGVIITTRFGKVLVQGRQVSEALDVAADSARSAARLPDVAPDYASASPNPFSSSAPAQPPSSEAIPGTNDPWPGSLPAGPPSGIPPTRDPRFGAPPPQIAGPGLLGDTGARMKLRRLNNAPGGAPAQAHVFKAELDGYSVRLSAKNFIGGGSTSWAYRSPSDPNVVIKLTFPLEGSFAGVQLDNYGYRLLDAAAIDPNRLHVPRVIRQHVTENGQIVTVVEMGPTTVKELRRKNGQLTRGMVDAIAAGTEELARNRIIWPDGKLDNMGLIDLGNDRWIMSVLDPGSMMVVDSADVARRFDRDVYSLSRSCSKLSMRCRAAASRIPSTRSPTPCRQRRRS